MAPADTECIAYNWYLKGATAFSLDIPFVREPTALSVESNSLPQAPGSKDLQSQTLGSSFLVGGGAKEVRI